MNQGIHSLVHFFVHSKWRRTTCCLLRKQQKFAVAGIFESAQSSSANGGSEPSICLGLFCWLPPCRSQTNYNLYLTVCLRLTAASLTAYSRCRLRHEVPWTSREYALLTPQASTGLIQVVFDILPTLFVRTQHFHITLPSPTPHPLPLPPRRPPRGIWIKI